MVHHGGFGRLRDWRYAVAHQIAAQGHERGENEAVHEARCLNGQAENKCSPGGLSIWMHEGKLDESKHSLG